METKLLLKVSYYLIKQSKAFKNYIFHLRFTQYLRQRAYIRLSNLESALKDHMTLRASSKKIESMFYIPSSHKRRVLVPVSD